MMQAEKLLLTWALLAGLQAGSLLGSGDTPLKGHELLGSGSYQAAITWFERKLPDSPSVADAHLLRGLAAARLAVGEYTQALQDGTRAVELAEDSVEKALGMILVARTYLEVSLFSPGGRSLVRGDPKVALELSATILRNAASLTPDATTDLHYWLGFIESRLDNEDQALESLRAFRKISQGGYYDAGAARMIKMFEKGAREGDESRDAELVPPKKRNAPQPRYPFALKRIRVRGLVVVSGLITEEGQLEELVVLKGVDPRLDAAVLKAVSRWTFKPARIRETGKPVSVYYTLSVNMMTR